MNIESLPFAKHGQEKGISLFQLKNDNNIEVYITNFGAIVTSILAPDKHGKIDDVVLGFDNLEAYEAGHPFFGAICGRYANRIGNASFTIEGKNYKITANEGANCLHGGTGFDKKVWKITGEFCDKDKVGMVLTYFSADNEEGFPGNMNVKVTYSLNNKNELTIDYSATTDKTTVVNLTNHCYFNLNGCKENITKHLLTINSKEITALTSQLIPTGEYKQVAKTAYDFQAPIQIAKAMEANGGGFDNNFVINKKSVSEFSFAAKAIDPVSGRSMEVYTTEPGIQLYTANHMDGSSTGKNNARYEKYFGFCLETQHYPDSPNQLNFPSTLLKQGETYSQKTVYKFGIEK